MSEPRVFYLAHDEARRRVGQFALQAPEGWRVEFRPPTRSDLQNAKLHSMFSDVARQHLYIGRNLNSYQWKNLFISGHAIATGLGVDMVPGLEAEFVNVRESSARMSIGRMSSLIEYVSAYGASNGVKWKNENKYREAA
jgi:hypothetical protein